MNVREIHVNPDNARASTRARAHARTHARAHERTRARTHARAHARTHARTRARNDFAPHYDGFVPGYNDPHCICAFSAQRPVLHALASVRRGSKNSRWFVFHFDCYIKFRANAMQRASMFGRPGEAGFSAMMLMSRWPSSQASCRSTPSSRTLCYSERGTGKGSAGSSRAASTTAWL